MTSCLCHNLYLTSRQLHQRVPANCTLFIMSVKVNFALSLFDGAIYFDEPQSCWRFSLNLSHV